MNCTFQNFRISFLRDYVTALRCRPTGANTMERTADRPRNAGFSLLEVSLVVVIGLIITATGLPRLNNAIANLKLRSSMTTLSGLIQNGRMMAVQRNRVLRSPIVAQTFP